MTWVHWAVLSAAFAGITVVLAKAGTSEVEPNLATAVRTTVVLALAWLAAFAAGTPAWNTLTARRSCFLVLSGLAIGSSWLCYFRALSMGEASSVAPVDKLSVVFAIALAAIFLGETLTWRHGFGGGLILIGAIVVAWI